MKSLLLTSCFALALTMAAPAADIPTGANANISSVTSTSSTSISSFAGKWVLDKKKSPESANVPDHLIQEIKPDGNHLIVKSRYDQPANGMYPIFWIGIMVDELELGTDGSETLNSIGPFDHRSKTTADGNTLRTEWKAMNGQVEGEWIRTLAEDGKQMTMQVKGKCADGREMTATLLFNRK